MLTFGYLSAESSSVDSDAARTAEPVPQSHRPLTATMKPSPESSDVTNAPQSTVETPNTMGQLVHVLQDHTACFNTVIFG